MKIVNPANDELIKEVAADSSEDIEQMFTSLQSGKKAWKNTELNERISIIKNFHDLLLQNIDELANILTSEVGKPLEESKGEINAACGKIQYFLENSEKWLTTKTETVAGNTEDVLGFEPLGVVANISAWNYPYLVGMNIFIPALICGNTVMYKPSEFATLTGLEIEKYLMEAGIPRNVFQVAVGEGNVGAKLLELNFDGYFFTGSYPTGKLIAEKVASKLVPVGLELGGKDPLYVADDVKSIKDSAISAASGAFYNAGQSCCSVERIYVHEKIYDDFVKEFVDETKNYLIGDPTDPKTNLGAITRKAHILYLEKQVSDAISKGAILEIGGKALETEGNYFAPTVLTNVNHEMDIMREETFGPLIGIQKVTGDVEALGFMQDTKFGLTGSVFSNNKDRAMKILNELDAGTAYWNCCDRVSPYLPWSGRGNSGLGSTLSYLGILAFTKPKSFQLRTLD